MAGDAVKRKEFVQSAVSFVKKYEFDGLDLDWEYPANRGGAPEDKANFVLLVKGLKTEFAKDGLLLTAAIGVGPDVLTSAYDFPQLCEHLDFLNLMMYDLHGSFDGVTGHHTSVYNHPNLGDAANSLNQSLHIIESQGGCLNKMVLGMGMYAQTSTLADSSQHGIGDAVTGPGNNGTFTLTEGFLGYYEVCSLGAEYEIDSDNYTMAPWKYLGDQWLCYDNMESLEFKSNWAIEKGLMGGMIWSIETDDFRDKCGDGKYPLLTTIYNIMTATSESPTTTETTTRESTSNSPTPPPTSTPSTSTLSTSTLSTKPPPTRPTTTTTTAAITSTVVGSSTGIPTEEEAISIYVFVLLGIIAALISLIFIIYLISKCTDQKPALVINNNNNIFN